MAVEPHVAAFLASVGMLYHAEIHRTPAAAEILTAVRAALQQAGPPRALERVELPACALLPEALAGAADAPLAAVAAAFEEVEPALAWTQNPNYSDERLGEGYMAGYAYAEVCGPRGLVPLEGVALGVLLLGPDRLYPDHNHAAAEVYHVLAGTAAWRREGEDWSLRPPGACILHAPWQRHAMRTRAESLLALYAWAGEVGRHADLTD